ncbi:unnamed protein product [Rhodiola kirilowii]
MGALSGDLSHDPTSIPRGEAGGHAFFAPSEERLESGIYSRSYLENQIDVALLLMEENITQEHQTTSHKLRWWLDKWKKDWGSSSVTRLGKSLLLGTVLRTADFVPKGLLHGRGGSEVRELVEKA